jgi:hypothetical protein
VGRIVLLGPQRLNPDLVEAVDAEGAAEPFAAITAGWEEREDEIDELRDHLGRRVVNLRLWHRGEEAFGRDPELFEAYRDRRARLREAHDAYRLRLGHLVDAWAELAVRPGRAEVLDDEREDALRAVRALDERHLVRVEEIQEDFEDRWRPLERHAFAAARKEVASRLAECPTVTVAGGHVAVLVNRMRLFGVGPLLRGKTVFAWSAGSMVVAERIVLFHDDPPQGPGHPEVFSRGLGLCKGVLALPHATRRLRLGDARRVGFLARRFEPLACVALDPGAGLAFDGRRWRPVRAGARTLGKDGAVAGAVPA